MKRHWRITDRHIPRCRDTKGRMVTRTMAQVQTPLGPRWVLTETPAAPITFHSPCGRYERVYRDEGRGVRAIGVNIRRPG